MSRQIRLIPLLSAALLACGGEPAAAPDVAAPPPAETTSAAPALAAPDPAPESALLASDPAPESALPAQPTRAMWVLCEGSQRVLEHPDRLTALIEQAPALGVTDLFVQVYRGGRAWFDSSLADASPYEKMVSETGGDPLAQLIARAHERGLRVHAWVNVLSLSHNPNPPIVKVLGRSAVQVDRRGRSILDYPDYELPAPDIQWYRMGTPGIYLDPAAPGVRERLTATFRELVERYPEIDGLHLDYIRHPGVLPFVPGSRFGVGLDFGYGEASKTRFQRETGLSAPGDGPGGYHSAWDEWRREQVTRLVASIRAATLEAQPDLVLSAAVIAYADRAYLSLAQDWRRWLEDGLLDFAVPMAYTRDDRLLQYQLGDFVRSEFSDRIWIGLGSWLFADEPERALAHIARATEAGVAGVALFSYDAIADSPALLSALRGDTETVRAE